MKLNKKYLCYALALGLVASFLLSTARFDTGCEILRDNVLRMHVLANSDSAEDQEVKLLVRDAVLAESETIFKDCKNTDEAIKAAADSSELLSAVANKTLQSHGFSYKATVSVEPAFFKTRVYDTMTLPAGTYEAVTIKLGAAEGRNWWCIMFPSVCISAATKDNNVIADDGMNIAYNQDKYIVKFWIVEIYEKILNLFEKK